jgi:hypothetical protein
MRFAASLALVLAACSPFSASDSPSSGGEAGLEASVLDGGGGSGWCASQTPRHKFCADFDDATPLAKLFDSITDSSSTNAVTLDSTKGSTNPGSLRFVIPAGVNDLHAYADLTFAGSAKGFRCELDVELDQKPIFVGSLVYIELGGIAITVNDTLTVTAGMNSRAFTLPGTSWIRVGIVSDFEGGLVTVTEGGTTVATRPLTLANPPPLALIHFGSLFPNDAFTMRYDNITCDPL